MTNTEAPAAITTIARPPLNPGEKYVGAIINADGTGNHIILLPGDQEDAKWQTQMDWAASIGGDLPNRVEQAMLFANMKDEFQEDWYWSNTTHATDSGYAWLQFFVNGDQGYWGKASLNRARAVRRVAI